ncbi:UDP-N-acetylmuramoylalanyl-D-glutamate--2,6-diaminopimelate ligase [Thalassoporum mexicanum PCC 7367]|uniref:UDP-N-acetylmuramoyl-L-alanyl-D-glutamate--2, 6-diaminopimelate ligase n=1 Tax=Thalassoporum mexicanum TaxID=3457544 RepID=UPI00029F85B9|nr:UDP-N-acetylmuramoyl-L-alanyl-D-glutamate--2,6-diaminopimelate ligase [Pseudanabaena sp. PCC 7367]AFY70656.1 UDP-N-acetylmuramoylalanyl-D-glutamate--2,6-diaminopimelate ligase [Pseudanabaena sp. PCC 7367]
MGEIGQINNTIATAQDSDRQGISKTWLLADLLAKSGVEYSGYGDRPVPTQVLAGAIDRLVTDSRQCQTGDLFIGMPGTKVDGAQFALKAIRQGAVAAIISQQADISNLIDANPATPELDRLIVVEDVIGACAAIATAFYDHPATKMQLVGVTGTNGKTTTTHIIEFLLNAQQPTALLGTLYARWPNYINTASHTTPFAIDLQAKLRDALDDGVKAAVLEVSSHALAQRRVGGCTFAAAVFTNLTQDHLDYHKDIEDYFQAKALLFNPVYLSGRAIVNLDDGYGQRLITDLQARSQPVWTYSLENDSADFYADFYTEQLQYTPTGVTGILHTPVGTVDLRSTLVGSFNVANLLAAIATALHLGMELDQVAALIPQFKAVPGRVEQVILTDGNDRKEKQDITVVVDYAHTPDSLENVLRAMRPFTQAELVCVFGCGGDRDRTKRPLMGEIAARLADRVYVTSDNPRTEEPQGILEDILAGIPEQVQPIVEVDRHQAIEMAILQANPGDMIVIAGKGHEDYQILGTEKIHFDDREEAQAALRQKYA